MVKDSKVMTQAELLKKIVAVLEDKKAQNLLVLNVRDLTMMTDDMIIATGSSSTQLRAMMNAVLAETKRLGVTSLGVEGEQNGEWILVDLDTVLVHLMLVEVRQRYELEKLWSVRPE